jgi:hypothetical protein
MILSYISYEEKAISPQTGRTRITFEENSGLSNILPADKILELLNDPNFVRLDNQLK